MLINNKMIKKNFIVLLSILILFLNQIYATYDYVPRSADIDRSPKNILVGSFIGGRSHLKPMLDITTILSERGYNVSISIFFRSPSNLIYYLTILLFFLYVR